MRLERNEVVLNALIPFVVRRPGSSRVETLPEGLSSPDPNHSQLTQKTTASTLSHTPMSISASFGNKIAVQSGRTPKAAREILRMMSLSAANHGSSRIRQFVVALADLLPPTGMRLIHKHRLRKLGFGGNIATLCPITVNDDMV
ncbi:hypothetical protein EG329_012088 [Mollisiaceae sp. DMI_Dod_QoI]|nr:hypothetical protein EG329_012088 [Helotiales sp. DMI_Dod_QoI]